MATTILPEFEGEAALPEEGAAIIYTWLCEAQGDADKASEAGDADYYQGAADALTNVMYLLHGKVTEREESE